MAFPARAVRNDLAAAPRKARCSRSSNFLSACQAPSFNLPCAGLRKKLLPSRVKEPRFPPSILRRTAYFQYAAWSATSEDVVAPRSRAPGGFFCGYSLEGLFEIRSVPGLFFLGFIKQREHELSGIHGGLLVGRGEEKSSKAWRSLSPVSTRWSFALRSSCLQSGYTVMPMLTLSSRGSFRSPFWGRYATCSAITAASPGSSSALQLLGIQEF